MTHVQIVLISKEDFQLYVEQKRILFNSYIFSFYSEDIICFNNKDFHNVNFKIGVLDNNDPANDMIFKEGERKITYEFSNRGGRRGFIILDNYKDFIKIKIKSDRVFVPATSHMFFDYFMHSEGKLE